MTTIDLDTSPLQAAREWRGIGRVAAALSSGLPVLQAEALEGGDTGAFNSVDEMIAAAVVYGASLGIGRDEAMALLDRTVTRSAEVNAEVPDAVDTAPPAGFSLAVRERSARMASRPSQIVPAAPTGPTDLPLSPFGPVDPSGVDSEVEVDAVEFDTPPMPSQTATALPDVPHGPTPEQAVEASQELHLGGHFQVDDDWQVSDNSGELESWASDSDRAIATTRNPDGLAARIADGSRSAMERVIGTDRSDQVAEWAGRVADRTHELTRKGREKLRSNEHATLFVAIGAGALLIALLVAIGGALGNEGGNSPAASGGPDTSPPLANTTPATPSTSAEAGADATAKAAPAAKTPMVAVAKLTVNVYNAGSQKGFAKDVASKIGGYGYQVGTVGNSKGQYTAATIVHPAGLEREATVLGKRLGITRLQEATGPAGQLTAVVT